MRPPSPWESYLIACAQLARNADQVYIGTYGIWSAYDSSPLILFLTHLDSCVKCPKQVIVGYNHRTPQDCRKYQDTIKAYKGIHWKYLSSFHSKYFIVRNGQDFLGFIGSYNLSDTAYDNLYTLVDGHRAKCFHHQHSLRWRRARKSLPVYKTRRHIASVLSVMEPTEEAADTGYQPMTVFINQLEKLEEN